MRRNRRVRPSPASADASANDGTPREEFPRLCSLLCGPGSARLPGRIPGGGVFYARREACFTYSTSSSVLVTVFCARWPSFAVSTLGYEWWDTVATTAAIDCCSWRHHERSLRLMAAPPRSAMADRKSFHERRRACVRLLSCETPGGSGGFDVRLDECVCPYPPVDAPDHGGRVPVDVAPPVLHLCAGPQKNPHLNLCF